MREIARLVANAIFVLGAIGGFGVLFLLMDQLGWTAVVIGLATLLSSLSAGCILHMLASIDERLSAAGWKIAEEVGQTLKPESSDDEGAYNEGG